jgi:hypothetical protein
MVLKLTFKQYFFSNAQNENSYNEFSNITTMPPGLKPHTLAGNWNPQFSVTVKYTRYVTPPWAVGK